VEGSGREGGCYVIVFAFAAAAGVFFLLADQAIRMAVTLLLGI